MLRLLTQVTNSPFKAIDRINKELTSNEKAGCRSDNTVLVLAKKTILVAYYSFFSYPFHPHFTFHGRHFLQQRYLVNEEKFYFRLAI